MPSWAVFDRQYLDLYSLANGGQGKIPLKWREEGYLKEADTIEGLAEKIGVTPATLKATVDRWNTMVDNGVDEDFHRGERAYDEFLGLLDGRRAHLKALVPSRAEEDPVYQQARQLGRRVQDALTEIFFERATPLRELTIRYGVF